MGKLYIVATPIGNLEDITIRAIKTLLTVPVIACEDTRRTGMLIKLIKERYAGILNLKFEILNTRFISVRDWNEQGQLMKIIEALQTSDVALVSDAGTPLISDPGYKLVNIVRTAGFEVVPIPGVSALTTALSAAGLPTNKVVFWGFFDKKYELDKEATNVFFESPARIKETLKYLEGLDTEIVIANEMTKIHERFLKPDEIEGIRGEITLLISFDRKR